MSSGFDQLLDASIRYLQELKREGRQFVTVTPENFSSIAHLRVARPKLSAPAPVREVSPAPAPSEAKRVPVQSVASAPAQEGLLPTESVERLTGEAKATAMADLRERAMACVKCTHLVRARRNVVFGVGNIDAQLMFVGEAPGMDEDQAGEPFVGRAGQLLTRIIETMGLKRSDVYIANILKCRPDTPGQSAGNRKPTPEEMRTCIPYLHAQIDLIGPKVLVALGATAVEGLLGKTEGIMRLRGHWHTYRNIPLMPTYHPAYLLRNQSLQEKRRIWEDMLQVMDKLTMPVTDRQRGFFLK
jgi:DNA polymerase